MIPSKKKKVHQRVHHYTLRTIQSSMVFPEKRSFYTSRNVNSDLITERKISLIKYLLY